jgi:transglycosylase-like protein with SLT domain
VVTRNGSRVLLGAALALTVVVVLGTAMIALFIGGQDQASCGAGGVVGGRPGPAAEAIPARLTPLYMAADRTYGVPWNVLAAINKVETDFGRNLNVSSAGAIGWMQFMPDTWARYGVDGNDDDGKDPYDPEDAIPARPTTYKHPAAHATFTRRSWPTTTPSGTTKMSSPGRAGSSWDRCSRPATWRGRPRPMRAPRVPRAIR